MVDNAKYNNPYTFIPESVRVQVLREFVLFKKQPNRIAITISPERMTAKQFVQELAFVRHLFGHRYFMVVEVEKQRLHIHGVITLKRSIPENMRYELEKLITSCAGFTKIKYIANTEKAILGWLQYMFKEADPLVYMDKDTDDLFLLAEECDSLLTRKAKPPNAEREAEEAEGAPEAEGGADL